MNNGPSFRVVMLGLLASLMTFVVPAHAEKRVALVIGNNDYKNVPKLQKAVNDARTMGETLRQLGFSVMVAENQTRQAFSETLLAFDKAVEPGDTAFFFYAGHGFEIAGQNFLLPTDVPAAGEGQEELVRDADLVIGAVLIAGAAAPKLVTRAMVKTMKAGAVLVDIAIDQGGCFETSHPTTHAEPTYVLDGVIHYAVTNMPGAVPRTSTFALTNATLPYVKALADHGWRAAISKDVGLAHGLNVHAGQLTHEAVASALGLDYRAYRAA